MKFYNNCEIVIKDEEDLFKKIVKSVGGFCSWIFIASPGAASITVHLSFDCKVIFSPIIQSSSNIIEDFALLRSNFFF